MLVQVSCKFDEGLVKNELRLHLVHNIFSVNKTMRKIFGAQEQVTSRCLIQSSPEIVSLSLPSQPESSTKLRLKNKDGIVFITFSP